ncbi:transposase, partial [Butyricimonas virosa]
ELHLIFHVSLADSGYGAEENYRYMEEDNMEAYVKYNRFHIEHRKHYAPNPFSTEGMYYNKEQDFYVCPMGQHMERIGTKHRKTDSGYITESARYRAKNCSGCPLRGQCFKATGNRVIEVNHKLNAYKKKVADLLTSEEGLRHRGRRCIEPESVFGQIKYNMAYRRFRHFGKDKIAMDFSFFVITFNIKKLCKMLLKGGCNDLHTLIKHLLEWILRLKLNTIVFLSYKQMKIAT